MSGLLVLVLVAAAAAGGESYFVLVKILNGGIFRY
jgi:hypothetical protein